MKLWHIQVEYDYVWLKSFRERYRLATVGGFAANFPTFPGFNQPTNASPENLVVVGKEDA